MKVDQKKSPLKKVKKPDKWRFEPAPRSLAAGSHWYKAAENCNEKAVRNQVYFERCQQFIWN